MLRIITLLTTLMGVIPTINAQTADLSVQTSASRSEAFVNEQILLRRRVHASGAAFNITGTSAQIVDADVLQLGEQSDLHQARQRQTATWAIFARSSGALNISAHEFQATLPATGGSNPVSRAASNPLVIRILPAPPGPAHSVWLPAANVTIEQRWSEPGTPGVGEPKNLLVTVTAHGQRAAAIPPLLIPDTNGLRLYGSPALLNDQITNDGVTGIRVEHYTVVAASAGQASLPSLSLDWFNTSQRAWNRARSNGLTFAVTPSDTSTAPTPADSGDYKWMALILPITIAALWIMTLLQSGQPSEAACWRKTNQLLRQGNPIQIRQAILHWARARWPSKRLIRFEEVAAMANKPGHCQILRELDAAAYGSETEIVRAVDISQLRLVLKEMRNRGLYSKPQAQSLARLYRV